MSSILEIYDMASGTRRVLREFPERIEAPNWTVDGKALVYNSGGRLYRFDLASGKSTPIETGDCTRCNNDHVLSADGKRIAISAGTDSEPASRIWVLPLDGGAPRLVTTQAPSYLHGWSPDGGTLAFCGCRGGEFDIYAIPAAGGPETRLTDSPGLNDGPEFSPDGRHIWFNSVRFGLMQLFRMEADGSAQTQMTDDRERNLWFPHVSPDGKTVVCVTYGRSDVEPGDHPPGKNVELLAMDAAGGPPRVLASLFGGQGTMNVNSWRPDSGAFAFVSYREE